MSEVQEVQQEETANPYNMRKDYGGEKDAPFQSADGVYHEPSQATHQLPQDCRTGKYDHIQEL